MSKNFSNLSIAYKVVYDAIMEELDKGVIPWKRPWKGTFPANAITGRQYRGINVWLLWGAEDHRWMTFNQVRKHGGSVNKGAKSRRIVLFTINEVDDENAKDGKKKFPILRYYNVFNVADISGIDFAEVGRENVIQIEPADEVVDKYKNAPKIKNGGEASYNIAQDIVTMPKQNLFDDDNAYYATLFHELVHSTGHGTRLNRKTIAEPAMFGSEKYSEEELIAELGSAFLCAMCGIDNTIKNSASYIAGWKKKLEYNPKIMVSASSMAQKAVDYMTGNKPSYENDEE